MHPLVARIHPSFRTSFFAFVIARVAVWFGTNLRLGRVFPEVGVAVGTPLYRGLAHLSGDVSPLWGPRALVVLGEVSLFVGTVAVYRFARREGAPQTADRAAWLWIACPAMAFALPGSDWAIAYGLVGLAAGAAQRPALSSVALTLAVAIRPEAAVLAPAFAWMWWRSRAGMTTVLWATLPVAAFALTVLGGVFGGAPSDFFAGSALWRHDFAWHGLQAHYTDFLVAGVILCMLAVLIRTTRDSPAPWFLASVAVIALVVARQPIAAVAAIPLAIPLFAQTARIASDAGVERVLLAASIVSLCLVAAIGP